VRLEILWARGAGWRKVVGFGSQKLSLEFGGLRPLPPSYSSSLCSPHCDCSPPLPWTPSRPPAQGKTSQPYGTAGLVEGGRWKEVSESSRSKPRELVWGIVWSLPLGTAQRKPPLGSDCLVVVDICLQDCLPLNLYF